MTESVLADHRSAPIEGKLRATLDFIEKLTLDPDSITPDDIIPLRQAGLSDSAIDDAIHICALFTISNRLSDSLRWRVPAADLLRRLMRILALTGYDF